MRSYLMAAAALLLTLSLASGDARAFIDTESNAPAEVKAELAKALSAIEAQQYQSAIDTLNALVRDNPRSADAYNLLGFAYRKLKDFERAERNYARALRIDPEHKGALEYMGELFLETNRRDKAGELLARLEKLCPDGCEELEDLRKAFADGQTSSRAW